MTSVITIVCILRSTWTIKRPVFKICFSNFVAVLHILFGIFLTVYTNWIILNSLEIRRLNIKSLFNWGCLWHCCLCCLNCSVFAAWTAGVCLHFPPSVCSRLPSLCLRVCLLCTRLSKHFSAVHSVAIVCAWDISLLFKLLKFRKWI